MTKNKSNEGQSDCNHRTKRQRLLVSDSTVGECPSSCEEPDNNNVELVIIIGGGIAGLALALALQSRNIPCRVFERDASPDERHQGYGLTLQVSSALDDLGLTQFVRDADCPSFEHFVFTAAGRVIGYFGGALKPFKPSMRGNLRVPREILRRALLAKLKPDTVVYSARLDRYETTPTHVTAHFDPPLTAVRGVLLVGADGIRSRVRRQLRGDDLQYLGVALILGISALTHPLLDARGFYTVDGAGARLFTMPFAPGLTMWQLSFTTPESHAISLTTMTPSQLRAVAAHRCCDWHEPVTALINEPSQYSTWATPLYDYGGAAISPDKQRLRTPRRVTLIGDAAHPMSPFKGQGANQALRDGPLLATKLQRIVKYGMTADRLGSTLDTFEREMLARAAAKVAASRDAVNAFHSPCAVAITPRCVSGVCEGKEEVFLDAVGKAGIGAWSGDELVTELVRIAQSLGL